MKVRYEFTSALAAFLLLFIFSAATPVFAQTDTGDAGFNNTSEVSAPSGTEFLGAAQFVDDGVTLLGSAVVGGTAYFNVVTNASGTLHVWVDEDGDSDFVDQDANQQDFVLGGGAATYNLGVVLNAATAGNKWFRFIFEETTNTFTDPDTDYTGTNGEIEDYLINIIASGSNITLNAFGSGVTTTVTRNGANIEVTSGVPVIFSAPEANILSLRIEGDNAGDDDFVLDMDNGDAIPVNGLTFDGNGQTVDDELQIDDNVNNATVTHNYDNENDGNVVVTDGTIYYEGLEPITDNVPAVSRVFNFAGSADTIVMDDVGGANDISRIDSDNSEVTAYDISATTDITVNAGSGADDITVEFIDGNYSGTLEVNGDGGNDDITLDLTSDGALAHGDVTVNGNANTDDLILTGNSYTSSTVDFDAGTIDVGLGNDVTFATVEEIDIDLTIESYTFDLTTGADAATLGDDDDADAGESQIALGSVDVAFNNPTGGFPSISVYALGGADDLTVEYMDAAASHSTAIDGGTDDDDLLVDFTNGNVLDAGTLDWFGDAGTNTWTLDNGSGYTTITHDLDGLGVNVDGGDFYYTDSPSGTDDLEADVKIFDLTTAADVVDFTDDGDASDDQSMVDDGTVTIVYRNADSEEEINGYDDDDIVTMEQLDGNYSGEFNFFGGDGDDEFIVDWGVGSPIANPTVHYDGEGESGGDTLTLDDGLGIATVDHDYDNANDGTVTVDGSSMTYEGLEPIDDNLTAATRTFTFAGTDDEIFLDADFAASDSEISSTSSSEVTVFSFTGLDTVIINGGGGDDEFDIEPSDEYGITVNGDAPAVLDGDLFTLDVESLPASAKVTLEESGNTAGTYSFSGTGSGFFDVSYTTMERVTLRFSDPNAFSGSTYEGDWMYPLHTESGISVEPYFNWDIELNQALPPLHDTKFVELLLEVSSSSDLSSPVFMTTTKEDGTTDLIDSAADEDHYITDLDRDDGILLDNDETYYWGLTGEMASSRLFCQIHRFKTIDVLQPVLDYPNDELTIYTLDVNFNWDVGSPAVDAVYWRMELDNIDKGSFVGDDPLTSEGLLMGEDENDDDTTTADGFADETEFDSDDLPTPLIWGTTYSWRVATMWPVPPTGWVPQEIFDKDETDRLVNVSAVSQFQTVTKAVQPILTYPVDDLIIYDNEPILSWNVGGPFAALTFTVTIFESGGAPGAPDVCVVGGVIAGVSGIQYDTADCVIPLEGGKTYDWYVTSTDGTSTSIASTTESFSILGNGAAAASIPSYPVGDLEIYTTAPSFHWYTGTAATGLTFVAWYKERVGVAETLCTGVKAGGTSLASVSITHADVSGLKPGATYDWCVVTSGTNGDFDSEVASFSVAGGAGDGIPIASFPIGNPTTYSLDQQVNWYVEGASLGIVDYTVEYCVSPDTFGDPGCTTVSGLTTTYYDILGLSYGDIVTWRVKASYTTGPDSDWTSPASQGSFTVTGELTSLSAVLTYPVGGLIIYDSDAEFSWYLNGASLPTGAVLYEVEWSYAETFPAIGSVTKSATTSDTHYDVTDLIPGHTYWWRVRISLDGGSTYGSYSAVATFDVHPGASAVMPRLGSPTRAISVSTANPTLSWLLPSQSTSALTYDLHVGQQADLSDAQVFENITASHLKLSDLDDGQYFWAVLSHSANGTTSALSSIGTFVTNSGFATGVETEGEDRDFGADNVTEDDPSQLDVDEDKESDIDDPTEQIIPTEYDLGQNYPNPFNPTTTIEFRMSQTAGVSVRVYNVLGQLVKTLVNGTLSAGIHRVNWDATDESGSSVTSGLYLYRMETDGFASVKTLVLMK